MMTPVTVMRITGDPLDLAIVALLFLCLGIIGGLCCAKALLNSILADLRKIDYERIERQSASFSANFGVGAASKQDPPKHR